ncbi:D-hexose-6-phosphate mutarotase [Paraferrimonas haliotis]|uniref:Putative glucose-6-phosphate 1-epimerase n=1 Tax=Paraferrimonas haliotis TaxID=2013866 RepID=A0AA37WVW1_9GAMM|nr:D-hexose-6-phosphate mutarotase [Paraferrimonas haliotis]GLS82577.1 D-hexose-6-phosphate mutarotase [Paraferrimonas haliotis]
MGFITLQRHPKGLEYLRIDTPTFEAEVYLQGAQLTHFKPKNRAAILWMSDEESYEPGNGLRGGVPICWPWFGKLPGEDYPQHGLVRKLPWQLVKSHEESSGQVVLQFQFPQQQLNSMYWPFKCEVTVEMTLSSTAKVSITTKNLDDKPFVLTQALHSYFRTSDILKTGVSGLQDCSYLEFGHRSTDKAPIVNFTKETDRVYDDAPSQQLIHTPEGQISVSRRHSKSCVLWNPWIDKAKRLERFGDDDYTTMVCLEAANVLQDQIHLEPDNAYTLTTEFGWQ